MSLRSLFLAAMVATAAGQSSRKKAVVMPFGLEYGEHVFGAWFGIPVTVGGQTFDLAISTSLSQSWVPGKELCATETNTTACTLSVGGVFDSSKSSSWKADASQTGVKISDELMKGFYNSSIATELEVGNDKKLLSMEGVGYVGTDTVTLKSDTGSFKMDTQAIGVIKEGDKANMANGYLSLQQMALSLYANDFTPSPTFHLFQGLAAYANDTELYLDSQGAYDWGRYLLIFGGYDSAILNLNTTQQYPLIETQFTATSSSTAAASTATDAPLPAPEGVSYGMQVMVEDIVYRWSEGGKSDNSLLPQSHLAIIDSSTPWIWLPKSIHDSLISITGAVWNDTYSSYVIPYCGYGSCDDTQWRAMGAILDFKFESMDGDKLSLTFGDYMMVKYLPQIDYPVYMVPVKSLPEDAPIILGRPFLAGIHLWVDYAELYWGMAQGNTTEQSKLPSAVIAWDRNDHAPITNSSILVQRLEVANGTTGSSSSSGSGGAGGSGTESKGLGIGIIAGIAGGAAVLVGALAIGCCVYRRKKRSAAKNDRPESSHELHSTSAPGVSELSHDGQLRPYELPQNQSQFTKPHELPPNQSSYYKPHELPPNQSSYYKPHELPQSPSHFPQAELPSNSAYYKPPHAGQYQVPPPPPGLPPQQGYYSPVTPPAQAYQFPPPQQVTYPPPPIYDMSQGGPGGPVYYEMDGGTRGHQMQ